MTTGKLLSCWQFEKLNNFGHDFNSMGIVTEKATKRLKIHSMSFNGLGSQIFFVDDDNYRSLNPSYELIAQTVQKLCQVCGCRGGTPNKWLYKANSV